MDILINAGSLKLSLTFRVDLSATRDVEIPATFGGDSRNTNWRLMCRYSSFYTKAYNVSYIDQAIRGSRCFQYNSCILHSSVNHETPRLEVSICMQVKSREINSEIKQGRR